MWADEPEMVHQGPHAAMAPEMFGDDMDMMDTSGPVLGHGQPDDRGQPNFEPGLFQMDPTETSVTGRVPTPIRCSFSAQIRGNHWNGPGQCDALATTPEEPNAAAFSSNGLANMTCQRLSIMGHENMPRVLDGGAAAAQVMADWNLVQQNRRLPSPISECGAEDLLDNSGMGFDSSSHFGGHLGRLTHEHPLLASLPPRASSALEVGHSARENTPTAEHLIGNAMDVESPGTPSPRKGHTRSKHTVNSWTTLQPGMKRSFSIGYRADCDKCRMKVPGHFNHIIIS
ncbi:hypothetical protein BT67DRAFT_41356 [Trichocladium antarcticum]|uniref:Uncharacterized protein n=1 Tax=Trichocladium antarcticum TaxID=1450529 RepID=A0AAN6ZDD3_9PEZI|nr:hypothetical protein BT67DRAFT_41356 [Trichocladium antarcticum]